MGFIKGTNNVADATKFYDLGQQPSKLNDVGREDKISYPCLYDIGPEEFPPLAYMRLGDTGEAAIKFKIKGGGIEIISIKMNGAASDAPQDGKAGKDKSATPAGSGEGY